MCGWDFEIIFFWTTSYHSIARKVLLINGWDTNINALFLNRATLLASIVDWCSFMNKCMIFTGQWYRKSSSSMKLLPTNSMDYFDYSVMISGKYFKCIFGSLKVTLIIVAYIVEKADISSASISKTILPSMTASTAPPAQNSIRICQ